MKFLSRVDEGRWHCPMKNEYKLPFSCWDFDYLKVVIGENHIAPLGDVVSLLLEVHHLLQLLQLPLLSAAPLLGSLQLLPELLHLLLQLVDPLPLVHGVLHGVVVVTEHREVIGGLKRRHEQPDRGINLRNGGR